jgi:DNA invertase Pin-like site-specific DNA recombinase
LSAGNETVIGYGGVRTTGRDLDAQFAALAAVGVDAPEIFTDKLSVSTKTEHPGFAALLDDSRRGDVIAVTATALLTGEPVHELADAFGISRAIAYRYLSATASP